MSCRRLLATRVKQIHLRVSCWMQAEHHSAKHKFGMEPHRRRRRRHSLKNAARGQHLADRAQRGQLRHFAGYSKVRARLIPACALRRCTRLAQRDALYSRRVLQAKISENRAQMIAKSQKPWVPGSLDPKPPAPPVKPPWQVPPLLRRKLPRTLLFFRALFSLASILPLLSARARHSQDGNREPRRRSSITNSPRPRQSGRTLPARFPG